MRPFKGAGARHAALLTRRVLMASIAVATLVALAVELAPTQWAGVLPALVLASPIASP